MRPEVALDHLNDAEAVHVLNNASFQPTSLPSQDQIGLQLPSHPISYPNADQASPGDVDDEHIDDLSTEVALLCLSAAGREPHYFGPSCAVSFSRIVSATMGLPKRGGSSRHSGITHEIQGPEIQRTVSVTFPSPNLATTLSQAYFRNIHPQYPFLHKPTFLTWEEKCKRADLAGDIDAAGDIPLFFVLMVHLMLNYVIGETDVLEGVRYWIFSIRACSSRLGGSLLFNGPGSPCARARPRWT